MRMLATVTGGAGLFVLSLIILLAGTIFRHEVQMFFSERGWGVGEAIGIGLFISVIQAVLTLMLNAGNWKWSSFWLVLIILSAAQLIVVRVIFLPAG